MARDLLARAPHVRRILMRTVAGVAARCPLPVARTAAYAAGTIAWFVDRRGRAAVERNLACAVPTHEARRRAVRRSYTEFATALAEAARLHRLPAAWLAEPYLGIVDPWRVFATRPLAGPAIIVSVHSHWDMLAAVCHRLGLVHEVLAPTLSYGDPQLDRWLADRRARWGCRTIVADRAPLAMLRALKAGGVLGMLIDRDYTGRGIPVRFLGRNVRLPTGPAALSVQTGAPIIPVFLARSAPSRFLLVVDRPLLVDTSLPRSQQVADLTARLGQVATRHLACAPAQWVAFHSVA